MMFLKKLYAAILLLIIAVHFNARASLDNDADIDYSRLLGSLAPNLSRTINENVLEAFSIMDLRYKVDRSKIESFAPIIVSGNTGAEIRDMLNKTLSSFESQVFVTSVIIDENRYTHITLQQYVQGYKVEGADISVHLDNNNTVYYVAGFLFKKQLSFQRYSISETSAQKSAVSYIHKNAPNQSAYAEDSTELLIFQGRLCYKVFVSYREFVPARFICYIDASSGEFLFGYNNPYTIGMSKQYQFESSESSNDIQHRSAVKVKGKRMPREGGEEVSFEVTQSFALKNDNEKWAVYDCNNSTSASGIPKSSAKLITNSSDDWGNTCPYGISAALNVSQTKKVLKDIWGFTSWDNKDGNIPVYVNWGITNAMFDGSSVGFGNGIDDNPIIPMDHACCLDVMAHEIGHGVSSFIGVSFKYQGESGTFSETFSDITAMTVEFASQKADTAIYPKTTPGCADWLMGEDAMKYKANGESDEYFRGRDLRNPWRSMRLEKYEGKSQPKYYKGKEWISSSADMGGVHVNAGVPCFAHYLLSMGTSGANGKDDPQGQGKNGEYIDEKGGVHFVKGLGIYEAAKLTMAVNTKKLLNTTATQADARNAWLAAAKQVGYGAIEVEAAFSAVGLDAQTRTLTLSKSDMDFGTIQSGKSKADTILLVNKDGKEATIVYALIFSDTTGVFSTTAKLPLVISGANSEKLPIVFSPKKAGTYEAKLLVRSNATDKDQQEKTIILKAAADGDAALKEKQKPIASVFSIVPNPVRSGLNAVTITFRDDNYSFKSLTIIDALGTVVYTENKSLPYGMMFSRVWNCSNKNGKTFVEGTYGVFITAIKRNGTVETFKTYIGIKQ